MASKVLQLTVKANKDDHISWLALANTKELIFIEQYSRNERGAIEMAIHSYRMALQLQAQKGLSILYQMLNNLGVLQLEIGDINSAAVALHAALRLEIPGHVQDSTTDVRVSSVANVESEASWSEINTSCEREKGTGLPPKRYSSGSHQGTILNEPQDSQLIQNALYRQKQLCPKSQMERWAAPVCTNLAQLYASFGTLSMASQLAQAAVEFDPKNVRCLLLLARLYLDVNQEERAQSYIDSAVRITLSRLSDNAIQASGKSSHENAADALAVACALQFRINNAAKTVDLLRKLNEMPGSSAYSHITLGRLHFSGLLEDCATAGSPSCRAHQLKFASDYARSALEMSPSCSMAAHILGLLLLELGQLDDAAIIFERLRESTLGSSRSQSCGVSWGTAVNLAHAYCLTGRWTEAASVYAECFRMPPTQVAGIPLGMSMIQPKQADLNHWLSDAWRGSENAGARWARAAATHLRPNDLQFRGVSAVSRGSKTPHQHQP